MPKFQWDSRKAASNLRKHGISFEDATAVFDDPDAIEVEDPDPDELRFRIIGMVQGVVLAVVYTERGGSIRLISARKATKHERNAYQQGSR